MRNNLFDYLVLVCLLFCTTTLFAVPATPYPVKITQPDGTEITIRLRGDERFKYRTTTDGYLLLPDERGILSYAKPDKSGKYVNTGVKASNIEQRSFSERKLIRELTPIEGKLPEKALGRVSSSMVGVNTVGPQRSYPLTGTPKSLVILVNFKDKSYVTPNPVTSFTNLLNEEGYSANYGTGSARDYFRDNSMGIFAPQFEVVGPFTLPDSMKFYGANGTDDNDKNPRQMVVEACKLADANGVDFTQYDTDNDGVVDNLFIYYAGYNEAETDVDNQVWPHRWNLANTSTQFDGKIVFDYACSSELKGSYGSNMCGIGTFVHEFGHVLGLPDYYATNGATHHTLSFWSVMDAGPYLNSGRTPPAYSAYDRFYLKWLVPTELKVAQNVALGSLTKTNKAYVITQNGNHNLNGTSPSPVEFFTIENRQKTGWDKYLPNSGLLITRIYYSYSTWNANAPNNNAAAMGVDIIEADGNASSSTLSSDVFPISNSSYNITSYSPTLRSGTNINKPLTYIALKNDTVTFRFMGGGNVPEISTQGTPTLYSTVQSIPSAYQKVTVSAKKLIAGLNVSVPVNSHFEIKLDTAVNWAKNIDLIPSPDSLVTNTDIYVRYNPTEPSFDVTHSDIIKFASTDAETIQLNLSGQSTKLVKVVPPLAIPATDVTISNAVANWEPVEDAQGYYLTAYGMSDGVSSFTEGFDGGLVSPIGWTISGGGLITSSFYTGKASPSIQLKSSTSFIETEAYLAPVTNLSFFMKWLAASTDTLVVKACNGTGWKVVDAITPKSVQTTKTYSFAEALNYQRFRFEFKRNAGSVILDDVAITLAKNVQFVAREKWVTTTIDTLNNLLSNSDYYYKVRASDKTYRNNKILYENITDFSNLVHVKTLADYSARNALILVPKSSFVDVNGKGVITVYLVSTDVTIYVYDTQGQLVKMISKPHTNKYEITGLERNKVYIIRAGDKVSKVIL